MNDPQPLSPAAGAGIGAAICRHLLDAGYDVISLARGKPDFSHDHLSFREVDLADPDATKQVADELAKEFNVTSLVNNAGVIRPSLIEDVKLEDLDYLTNLHLGAAITLTQAFLPAMKAAGFGRIVNMSSRAVVGLPTRTSYAGTKAAIISMTRTWAMELGKHGITVNAIAPGPIRHRHVHRRDAGRQRSGPRPRRQHPGPTARHGRRHCRRHPVFPETLERLHHRPDPVCLRRQQPRLDHAIKGERPCIH